MFHEKYFKHSITLRNNLIDYIFNNSNNKICK
jgi:hypothetical protein